MPSPAQQLPTWMSWYSVTIPIPTGGYTVSFSILQLPLTYYGPSIPLPSDGSWVYGGLSSPVATTSSPAMTTRTAAETTTMRRSSSWNSQTSPGTSFLLSTTSPDSTSPPRTSTHSSLPSSTSTISLTSTTMSPISTSQSVLSSVISSSSASRPASTTLPGSSSLAHSRLSKGAIVGIVVGAVVLAALLSICATCLCLRSRRKRGHRRVALTHRGSFGEEDEEDGWEIVGGPGVSSAHTSRGSGQSTAIAATQRPLSSHAHDGDDELDQFNMRGDSPISSLFVRAPVYRKPAPPSGRTSSWYHPANVENVNTMPASIPADGPHSPESEEFAEEHDSLLFDADMDPEVLAAAGIEARAIAGPGPSTEKAYAARAREAVAARNARQRSPPVSGGGVGIMFNWFRSSWASSRRNGPKSPTSPSWPWSRSRTPSEKASAGASQGSKKSLALPSSDEGVLGTQHSRAGTSSSEKSVLVPPGLVDSDDSPPTPESSQFPSPPATFPEAHAFVRSQNSRSPLASLVDVATTAPRVTTEFGETRPMSGHSGGSGVTTIYHDALDTMSSRPSPGGVPSPSTTYFTPNTAMSSVWLQPPPQLHSIRSMPSISSENARTLSSNHSGSGSSAPSFRSAPPVSLRQNRDILDDPAPLPSVTLQPPPVSSGSSGRTAPLTITRIQIPPPGLEYYRRPISERNYSAPDLVDLEEAPPAAEGDWRLLAESRVPILLPGHDVDDGDRQTPHNIQNLLYPGSAATSLSQRSQHSAATTAFSAASFSLSQHSSQGGPSPSDAFGPVQSGGARSSSPGRNGGTASPTVDTGERTASRLRIVLPNQ